MMWHTTIQRLSQQLMVILRTLPLHQISLQIEMEAAISLTLLAPAHCGHTDKGFSTLSSLGWPVFRRGPYKNENKIELFKLYLLLI